MYHNTFCPSTVRSFYAEVPTVDVITQLVAGTQRAMYEVTKSPL